MRRKTVVVASVALALTAMLSAAAFGVKPPGVGEEETAGNNLSIPAIFIPDGTGGPALRVPCGDYVLPGDDGVPSSEAYPGYWLQKTEATWTADCAVAGSVEVIADWGDNVTSRPALKAKRPVRVEVSLLYPDDALDETDDRVGFMVTNLTPELLDRLATYGTRPEDLFVTSDEGAPLARVFDKGATLKIEKLDANGDPVAPPIFDGPMSAEINSVGGVVYGYNWQSGNDVGEYRLTFSTVNAVITGIADVEGLVVPEFDSGNTWLEVILGSGNSGKGGGAGGGGDRGGPGEPPSKGVGSGPGR